MVCSKAEASVVFKPCLHMVACDSCSSIMMKCVKCRTAIETAVPLSVASGGRRESPDLVEVSRDLVEVSCDLVEVSCDLVEVSCDLDWLSSLKTLYYFFLATLGSTISIEPYV